MRNPVSSLYKRFGNHGRKLPRPAAIALVYFFIVGLLTLLVSLTGPVLQRELTVIANSIPEKVQEFRQLIDSLGENTLFARLLELEAFNPDEITSNISDSISRSFDRLATKYATLIEFTTGIFMTIVIIPFLLYLMLKEKGKGSIPILSKRCTPREYVENINDARTEMNSLLASYV